MTHKIKIQLTKAELGELIEGYCIDNPSPRTCLGIEAYEVDANEFCHVGNNFIHVCDRGNLGYWATQTDVDALLYAGDAQ